MSVFGRGPWKYVILAPIIVATVVARGVQAIKRSVTRGSHVGLVALALALLVGCGCEEVESPPGYAVSACTKACESTGQAFDSIERQERGDDVVAYVNCREVES